jgi:hypothetical protein
MTRKGALEDIYTHIGAISNAEVVQSALSGSRSTVAVNHIIAMSESQNLERPALLGSLAHLSWSSCLKTWDWRLLR